MMIFRWLDTAFRRVQLLDFLPLLAIRIYLPIFYEGAHAKLTGFSALVQWFGAPAAGRAQHAGSAAHGDAGHRDGNGRVHLSRAWPLHAADLDPADGDHDGCRAVGSLVAWLGCDRGQDGGVDPALQAFMEWLAQNFPGRFNYITKLGDPIILNNGIEFTVTYVIMLAVLLFYGAGRFLSLDYWIARGRPLLFGWLLPAYHDAALVRPTGSPPMPQPTGYPAPAI
jgi:hypothetical protein